MKRTLAALIALTFLFLAGCGTSGTEETERGIDTARSFAHSYKVVQAAETEDTIYYIGEHDNFIKYVDKATGITGPCAGGRIAGTAMRPVTRIPPSPGLRACL